MSLEMDLGALTSSGIRKDRLEEAGGMVAAWVAADVLPAAALLIARGDKLVAEGYWGLASIRTNQVAGRDTLWSIASITKPVTAMAVMTSVEKGLLRLDAPIVDSLPEFAGTDQPGHWRNEVTLRHLLTHTSGLAGFSRDNLELRRRHAPIDDFIVSFLTEDVHFEPGRWHLYSSVGFGLAAEMSGRALIASGAASGINRPLLAHESHALELLAGLGAGEAAFRPDEDQQQRCVWVESTGQEGLDWEIGNSRYYRSLGMPWGGLFMTARGVLALVQAFLTPGGTFGEMVRQQAAPPEAPVTVATSQRDVTWDPTSEPRSSVPWGLGWEVKGDAPGEYFGSLAHDSTFGHYGASGTMAWADPEEELAVVLLTNRAWVSRWPVQERRAARLADAVVAALD
jgi:CubicO group peptidase (beta-lactamase class C family)